MNTEKKKFSFTNFLMIFFITFLPIFSFGIFAPTEIFFANYKDLGIIFSEFGWKFLGYGSLTALILSLIIFFLPKLVQKILLSILWIISVAGYIQTMFLNKNMALVGATTEGYIPTTATIIKDSLIWLLIIIAAIAIIILTKEKWAKVLFLVSLILLATQGIAYGTLFLSAEPEAFEYREELMLSGEGQYTVSSKENVIVFVIDTISSMLYDSAASEYPEMEQILSDFTYYNNSNPNVYGTYPSIPHILTGYPIDPYKSVNNWLSDAWSNDNTTRFYSELHEDGYEVSVYTPEPWLFVGTNPLSIAKGKVDNIVDSNNDIHVDYPLLYKTLLSISCYRFMPDYFKPYFDVPNTQYALIATYADNTMNYTNPDFYKDLVSKGLSTTDEHKSLIFYHLNGIHELINDENCMEIPVSEGTYSGTLRGIWTMLEEYLNQLKASGVYDNSTIIITSDHGSEYGAHNVFFIKEAGTTHDEMQKTNAPITLNELIPTIAKLVGQDSSYLGQTIYDFSEDQWIERTFYDRAMDSDYPVVPNYTGQKDGAANVWRVYTYSGDLYEYIYQYDNYQYETIPMVDSYF